MNNNSKNSFFDTEDIDFLSDIELQLTHFIQNKQEDEFHFPPMNSYQRRLVHHLALSFSLDTASEGEKSERYIIVKKTAQSAVKDSPQFSRKVWDFGDNEYFVANTNKGINIVLLKDGSIGIYENQAEHQVVFRKLIKTGSFKIKENKIVECYDEEWSI